MTETENPIEEKKTATAKFAEWLMKRDERRQEKESNLEGLMKFNIFLSHSASYASRGRRIVQRLNMVSTSPLLSCIIFSNKL